jgi:hypothetical protein
MTLRRIARVLSIAAHVAGRSLQTRFDLVSAALAVGMLAHSFLF